MPRAPSAKMLEAEKLYNSGMAMVDIAKKLGISDGTVRSWKNRYKWSAKSKKNKCNVAKKDGKKSATLQKRKKGGQPRNKNAKGSSGNPNPNPPPDMTKHGGYKKVYWDVLSDEEWDIVENMPSDVEILLLQQIQLFSVRERRIMQAINRYRNMDGLVALAFSNRSESKRAFKNEEDEKRYNELVEEKVRAGERMPGNGYTVFTQTDNKDQIILRLENELSNVQAKKTKAIDALSKLYFEKQKIEGENKGNEVVKSWVDSVLKARGEENG